MRKFLFLLPFVVVFSFAGCFVPHETCKPGDNSCKCDHCQVDENGNCVCPSEPDCVVPPAPDNK